MTVINRIYILILVVLLSGCASGNYTTKSGKKRNAWVDLLVVSAAASSGGDSARDRVRRSSFITGYLADDSSPKYKGQCACPYDLASDGSRCGARSAWSKKGGDNPKCDWGRITSNDIEQKEY